MRALVDHGPIFSPVRLEKLRLDNRLVMAPMTRRFSPTGAPGPDVAGYYRRRAENGVGLIITEGTWIPHPAASNEPAAPRFYGDDALAGWRRVAEEVHAAGAKIFPQLWHVGLIRKAPLDALGENERRELMSKVSPSGYLFPEGQFSEGMDENEVEAIISAYASAARSARDLGFDGIEIHGAHGYLLDQFLWRETNHRADRWGGPSLGDRAAFAVAVVKSCRAVVGPDFPICFRFSQWKLQDFRGRLAETPRELEQALLPLVDAGADILHASQHRFWEPAFEGSDLNLAGWAKKITGKPSIAVGSVGMQDSIPASADGAISSLEGVSRMLERGDFDLIAVGRRLLADPQWGRKIRNGDPTALDPYDPSSTATLS